MKTKLFAITWLGIFLLISCAPANLSTPTPNVVFIKTSAAQTVVANFTLTAASAAFTSTPTSLGTPTSPATPTLVPSTKVTSTLVPTQIGHPGATQILLCNEYSWDDTTVDVNIPDNTQMTAGQSFVKTWKIKTAALALGYRLQNHLCRICYPNVRPATTSPSSCHTGAGNTNFGQLCCTGSTRFISQCMDIGQWRRDSLFKLLW